jgi:hypothetical protein
MKDCGSLIAAVRPLTAASLFSLMLAGSVVGVSAEQKVQPLTLALSATVSTPRSEVTVRTRVERDPRSRELVIEWVSDDLSGGSTLIALDGERAASAHRFTLKNLSSGQYTVTAILRRNDGTETRKESNLWVVGLDNPAAFEGALRGPSGSLIRPANRP